MSDPASERLRDLYLRLRSLPPADRAAALAAIQAQDPHQARTLAAMLQARESGAGFLEQPIIDLHAPPPLDPPLD